MSDKIRANQYLFFADFLSDLHRLLKRRHTVVTFVFHRHEDVPPLEFEVRLTRLGVVKLPATRKALTEKQWEDAFIRVNARRLLQELNKGAPRREAAPDGARKRKEKSK